MCDGVGHAADCFYSSDFRLVCVVRYVMGVTPMNRWKVREKKLADEKPVCLATVAIGSELVTSRLAAARTRTSLTNSIGDWLSDSRNIDAQVVRPTDPADAICFKVIGRT